MGGRAEVSVGLPEEAAEEEVEDQNQPIVSFVLEGEACRFRSVSVEDGVRDGDYRRVGMRSRG